MKKLTKWGSYVWTASSAGWIVLGYVTQVPEAYAVGIGCAAMGGLWLIISEAW